MASLDNAKMASHATGNTKPWRKCAKSRNWFLTLNEATKYEMLKDYLMGLKTIQYYKACRELAPSTGHEHYHIYCQFTNTILLSPKKTYGAHIEVARGST